MAKEQDVAALCTGVKWRLCGVEWAREAGEVVAEPANWHGLPFHQTSSESYSAPSPRLI